MPHSTIKTLFAELRTALENRSPVSLFNDGAPVLIYGAGNVGKDVFKILTRQGISVTGFLDQQAPPGSEWSGVPIRLPDEPTLSAAQRQRAHVVIGIFNAFVEIPPIVTRLKKLGYGSVTSFLELHDQFAGELGDRFWLTARNHYCGQEKAATAACELWSDEASRDLYARTLRFRFSMDYEVLPPPERDNQYFVIDLTVWLWTILFRGQSCRAYNVGSEEALTIRQVADAVAMTFQPARQVMVDREPVPGAATQRYIPSIKRAQEELGLQTRINLKDSIQRTIAWHLKPIRN